MSNRARCTCSDGYNPECEWAGHHELVKRHNGLEQDDAGAFVYFDIYDRDIQALEKHERQTHDVLGAILGTDDSLERVARRAADKIAEQAAVITRLHKVLEARRAADKIAEQAAVITRLHKVLEAYAVHAGSCILNKWQVGRPTTDGDYESLYGDTWYRSGDEPACTCGLTNALQESTSDEAT